MSILAFLSELEAANLNPETSEWIRRLARAVQDEVGGGGGAASAVTYDNTASGLAADDVQEAIDELATETLTVTLDEIEAATASAVVDHGANTIDWAFDLTGGNRLIVRDNANTDTRLVLGPFSHIAGRRGDGEAALISRNAAGSIQAQVVARAHITQPNASLFVSTGVITTIVEARTTGITLSTNGSNGLVASIDRSTFRNAAGQGQLMLGPFSAPFATGNYVGIVGAANGSPATVAAYGTADADVDLLLLPKGTGSVLSAKATITGDNGLRFTSQTSGAGASAGTITNAPSAGDPAFWLRVNINGADRFIPAWA